MMTWKLLSLIIVILSVNTFQLTNSGTTGCTAPLVLPQKPFFVVWNHPTGSCHNHGIDLGFEKWGIIDNSKDHFIGEQISLFYNLGRWPHYSGQNTYNGGIPQLADDDAHIQKVDNDLSSQMPDTNFSGLGVIDFEYWRPLFSLNYDRLKIYQTKSIQLTRQRHPEYNKTQYMHQAMREFNIAARTIVGKTIREVTSLRPKGLWGYYGYPRCWDNHCNTSTIAINDKMRFIFNTSTGLYPSLYFQLNVPPQTRDLIVKKKLMETLRVKAKWSPQHTAILPYANNQNGPYKVFAPADLQYEIRQPADMGSSGVVLWGSSSQMHAKNECQVLRDYINKTLGPYSLAVTNYFGNCTEKLCSGNGRCVRKDYEAFYQQQLREAGRAECLIDEEKLVRRKRKSKAKGKEKNESGKENSVLSYGLNWFLGIKTPPLNDGQIKGGKVKLSPLETLLNYFKLQPRNEMPLQNTVHAASENVLKFKSEVDYIDKNADDEDGDDSDLYHPFYDFDDYVCKCFAGWTGDHCNQPG